MNINFNLISSATNHFAGKDPIEASESASRITLLSSTIFLLLATYTIIKCCFKGRTEKKRTIPEIIPAQRIARRWLYRKSNLEKFQRITFGPRDTTGLPRNLRKQGERLGVVTNPVPPLRSNACCMKEGQKWVDMHPEECRTIATKFLQSIKHYSYKEFVEGLRNSIERFNLDLMSLPVEERDYILLIGPLGSVTDIQTRSNSWVASIALKYLAHPPKYILRYDAKLDKAVSENFKRILLLDDAAYTANQIIGTLNEIDLEPIRLKSLTIHLVIPFISDRAFIKIAWCIIFHSNIKIVLEKHIRFPNLVRIFNESERIQLNAMRGKGSVPEPDSFLSLTYFDHKIPDSMSTLNDTLEYGKLLLGSSFVYKILEEEGLVQKENGTEEEIEAYNKRFNEIESARFFHPFIPLTLSPYKVRDKKELCRFVRLMRYNDLGISPIIPTQDKKIVINTVDGIYSLHFGKKYPQKIA